MFKIWKSASSSFRASREISWYD